MGPLVTSNPLLGLDMWICGYVGYVRMGPADILLTARQRSSDHHHTPLRAGYVGMEPSECSLLASIFTEQFTTYTLNYTLYTLHFKLYTYQTFYSTTLSTYYVQ